MELLEAFDKPLPFVRNKEEERIYQKAFYEAGIRYFEIYSTKLGQDKINFYVFMNQNRQYEIHFSNSTNDHKTVTSDRYKNNQLTRIIATGLNIAAEKLKTKTTPFLIYGSNKRMTELYIRAIKTKIPNIVTEIIEPVRGIDGNVYPFGMLVTQDDRSFKLENLLR
jgi:hypothetical protein